MHERYRTPIRLGFFLERREVTCSMHPGVPYSGVDRLPNEGYYDDPQPRLWDHQPMKTKYSARSRNHLCSLPFYGRKTRGCPRRTVKPSPTVVAGANIHRPL